MSEIARLRDIEISNGNLINADDLDTEFNQLINESNSQNTRITTLEGAIGSYATETGTNNFTGTNTFAGKVQYKDSGELTIASGAVTVTGPNHTIDTEGDASIDELDTINGGSDGSFLTLQAENGSRTVVLPHNTGNIYNPRGENIFLEDQYQVVLLQYQAALTKWVVLGSSVASLPYGFILPNPPEYVSATQVRIPAGFRCRDDSNTYDIVFDTSVVANITASGANGLDTGTEAINTWYYLWVADNSLTGASIALLSASSTSPTLPSGYDKKRRLPIAIRNDSSGNFIPFYVADWPNRPLILYNVASSGWLSSDFDGPTQVLNGGGSTSWLDVNCASFVPPISTIALMKAYTDDYRGFVRSNGATHEGMYFGGSNASNLTPSAPFEIEAPGQIVEYKVSSAGADLTLDVMGFRVTDFL